MAETLTYDRRTPKTKHAGLAAAMFGDYFRRVPAGQTVLNVAAGTTELARDLEAWRIPAVPVISVDPLYRTNGWYVNRRDRVPATAEDMPFDDNSFALTLCQFGLQHMLDRPAAVREMVRVTKSAEGADNSATGTILLNPVFKPGPLWEALTLRGLRDVCTVQAPLARVTAREALPTLVIRKTPDLTSERLETLITTLTETQAMQRRRTLGERIARAWGGYPSI